MNSNFIINASASQYEWKGESLFSFKSFQGGTAVYTTKNHERTIGCVNYLLLQEGVPYRILIDHQRPVHSFCVFFSDEFVRNYEYPNSPLLDGRTPTRQTEWRTSRAYPSTPQISSLVEIGKRMRTGETPMLWIDEFYHSLFEELLGAEAEIRKRWAYLHIRKRTVADEVMRRLVIARDFLESNTQRNPTLQEVSATSMLSPNHLIRLFKRAFGTTPFRYLASCKLRKAHHLIQYTDLPVGEIISLCGFSSQQNFSTWYKAHYGFPPTTQQKR